MNEGKLCYLTLSQAAEVLQVSKDALRRLITEGTLPASRWGPRLIRIARNDIDSVAAELAHKNQECARAAQQASRKATDPSSRGKTVLEG